MTTETRTDRPLIWAHANTPAAVDAVREVLMRAKLSEPTLSYVLTAPASEVTYAPDVVILDEADSQARFGLVVRELSGSVSLGGGQRCVCIVWIKPSPVNPDPLDQC